MSVDRPIQRVAVIGAGAAGLVAARELLRAGFNVQVFERGAQVGGVWVYSELTETDQLGVDVAPSARVHSSLYRSLRTNLPRDLMAYLDYPFDSSGGGADDWPRFPAHGQVLCYLQRFCQQFALEKFVQFNSNVECVAPEGDRWRVHVTGVSAEAEPFDAVVVCNGHYSVPRVPRVSGDESFPGERMHSHSYRDPEPFRDKVVALWGASASGWDIVREIALVARAVYWCGGLFADLPDGHRWQARVGRMPNIVGLFEDGRVQFAASPGAQASTYSEPIDCLMYCTGYRYEYSFLGDLLQVDDNHVQPLYRDLLHVDHPTLALMGIPFRVVPFPLFEMQAKWLVSLWRRTFVLPPVEARRAAVNAQVSSLVNQSVKKRHYHQRTLDCYDYLDGLADEAEQPPVPAWHRQLCAAFLAHAAQHGPLARDLPLPHFGPTKVPAESVSPL